MKLKLYSEASLSCDWPGDQLRQGDVVKLVDEHESPGGGHGYSAEVFNALGEAVRVVALPDWALEELRPDEVLCNRSSVD